MPVRVGVYGATGQVGGVMRRMLGERGFPVGGLRYFAIGDASAADIDRLAKLFKTGAS